MWIRKLLVASITVGMPWLASCSSSDSPATGQSTGAVGSACSKDSDCSGYAKPTCVTDLKPLDGLIYPDGGTAGENFAKLDIPFPGGYCSNTVADSCQTDADCGSGGGCYRPFTGVDPVVLSNLDKAVKVFSVTNFATKGLCFAPCKTNADCRGSEGYVCEIPLEGFIGPINPTYKNTYCTQHVDAAYLLGGGDAGP